jgi:sugar phosphate isomerase/epimerase
LGRRSFLRVALCGALAGLGEARPEQTLARAPARRLSNVGLQLYTVREQLAADFDGTLARVAALGFDSLDVWGAHLGADWATDEHVGLARAALARHGLAVSTYATWVAPANVERACELALALGTTIVGAGFSGEPERLAPVLRAHGVRLAVENHPERSPAELLEKIERGGETFGATVDTGWWATHGYDPVRALEELDEHILHVHLKDVVASGEPHVTCRWGEGIVDVERCVRALVRLGYERALAVEHEPEDRDPAEECRAMREQLERWLA